MRKSFLLLGCLLFMSLLYAGVPTNSLKIVQKVQKNAFPIVDKNGVSPILTDDAEDEVIRLIATELAGDIELITGSRPALINNPQPATRLAIIAGTVGRSKYIDAMVQSGKLDVSKIQNQWESFKLQVIDSPISGIDQALVVAGSDNRGTIFGMFEISRLAGVSPWVWWADVNPSPAKALYATAGSITSGEPSVKYRGIFLNDEDWGLQPWAAKTFEPETRDIGPKTYEKIFQLMYRLRANSIWPAMHECTQAFYQVPGNNEMAQKYNIVVGTSHCEPMMRNNVAEWKHNHEDYNYFKKKDLVDQYWEERISEVKDAENIVTLGMRGIHDSGMLGGENNQQKNEVLEKVLTEQRNMLSSIKKMPVENIATQIVLYKEVLDLYNAGMKIPEDVSIVWCDDNYGYITRLSNEEEQKRSGGSGVYYHASYWGRPHDYLWLSSVQPGLMWYEMNKAYQNGAKNIWILNVGDIKPNEYATELFLDMAWNIDAVNESTIFKHQKDWAAKQFGDKYAAQIAAVTDEYYRLAMLRKPEYMGWSRTEPTTKTMMTQFNPFANGNEVERRLENYRALMKSSDELMAKMPEYLKDAYFQLVHYPVKSAGWMNEKFLNYQLAQFAKNEFDKQLYQQKSQQAFNEIQQLTSYYNNEMSQGKWKNMMSAAPRKLPVFAMPDYALSKKDSLLPQLTDKKPVFIQAKDFVKAAGSVDYQWNKIAGLGYSNAAITLFPFATKEFEKDLPWVEYEFEVDKPGDYVVEVRCLPTHSNDFNHQLTVQVDDHESSSFLINTKGRSEAWKINTLRNYNAVKYPVTLNSKGKHQLKLSVNQTGIVIDQMAVNPVGTASYYEIIKSE